MNKSKSIYELELHEAAIQEEKVEIIRVPGGWIYCLQITDSATSKILEHKTCFVPYSDEFKPKDNE